MLWFHVALSALKGIFVSAYLTSDPSLVELGPLHPATKGEVWPRPRIQLKRNTFYTYSRFEFKIRTINYKCDLLNDAINRYGNLLASMQESRSSMQYRRVNMYPSDNFLNEPELCYDCKIAHDSDAYHGSLQELEVDLIAPCEEYPYLEMDESYNLTVLSLATLRSGSIWGILRGLETFVQLFYFSDDLEEIRVNATRIKDYPRYPHRGLLLDTSRHFITVKNIMSMLDAMAMNKMNVFHWHIVDDESFPYQSEKIPELSERGAYHPSMIYSKIDVEDIIKYARDRGIRVVPEFDVPGHTRSWGAANPNLLTRCYQNGRYVGLGPMDPSKDITVQVLTKLFHEIQNLFPDDYIHLGGDAFAKWCWSSNPEVQYFMEARQLRNTNELLAFFMQRVFAMTNSSKPIVWQEVFEAGLRLAPYTVVQVWRDVQDMKKALYAGFQVVFSGNWYLGRNENDSFRDYYMSDLRRLIYEGYLRVKGPTRLHNIIGGEACMWGKHVDDRTVLNMVWPGASAVAESLWSSGISSSYHNYYKSIGVPAPVPHEVMCRVEEHICRMIRRGVPAYPISGPGYCIA